MDRKYRKRTQTFQLSVKQINNCSSPTSRNRNSEKAAAIGIIKRKAAIGIVKRAATIGIAKRAAAIAIVKDGVHTTFQVL
ncbi:hypothetical protein PanWU01x14_065640 [Parasponia andersonii]|uniref:Uncharacterized protein n=1 Tax=Parasponia andersonii TaxID=3476 RepID=A0A2P5DGV7_PARAD|nr:hypothetical protein PanWU01x14_065640 [Parasponia andersonii]